MTDLHKILTHSDVIDLEEIDAARRRNAAIVDGAARNNPYSEGPMRLQRPERHGRSLSEAETADYRWLDHQCGVLKACLRDAGQVNAKLRDRALDAEHINGWLWLAAICGWGCAVSAVASILWGR